MSARVVVKVHQEPIRDDADRLIGININYIRDHDANRPQARPLAESLREMGVRWIRYPGGGKSDCHRWALPPYVTPESKSIGGYERFPGRRINFDEFLALSREVQADPFVVLGYHPEKNASLSLDEWIQSAVAWVRWSRDHGATTRWWEIGNENWNTQKGTPEELAEVVCAFAEAIRAEDPTIRLGASGHNAEWWERFVPLAAPSLDFLTYSHYSGDNLGCYDRYLEPDAPQPAATIRRTLASIRSTGCNLPLVVTETNSTDYGSEPVWPHKNTIGHAIVTFDTIAAQIAEPDVIASMLWNTRWMDDQTLGNYYALDPDNGLTCAGRALQMISVPMLPVLLRAQTDDPHLLALAAHDEKHEFTTVWFSNRSRESRQIDLHGVSGQPVSAMRLFGVEPDDESPVFEVGASLDWVVPPLSITAFRFRTG